ncbi:MAG: hypothetical protein L0Y71_18400 [Gemmataceae bacterium]|nr:hypothetical protein [Gemmataceae bacterium]
MRIVNRLLPAAALAVLVSAQGQLRSQGSGQHNGHAEASRNVQHVLNRQVIENKHFDETMPLSKFLAALESQIGKTKIALRIDKEAFGERYEEVAATPVSLPPYPKQMHFSMALRIAQSKLKFKHDVRYTPTALLITTPERALYSASYDIRAVLEKPEAMSFYPAWDDFRDTARRRQGDALAKAAQLVQMIAATVDLPRDKGAPHREPLQVVNGTRLLVHANATKHADVEALLQAFRRLGDLWVVASARLYEVDEAFYTRVKNAKRSSREDLEEEQQRLVSGVPSKHESLFKFLKDHTVALAGDEVKVDSGFEATLLSRHQVLSCLAGPEQFRKGQKDRQTVLEGIAFVGGIHISSDRRYVRIRLTEKAAELDAIEKQELVVDNEGNKVIAETPLLKEINHIHTRDIPDGGTLLLPVHYRPRELRDKNRWWVLTITPRIVIPEEEDHLRFLRLEATLPLIVADILNNPQLKSVRELYGSPGDKRFALVNSAAWTWPKELKLATPGRQLTPATKTGRRLLGIRVERVDDEITVGLVNAGGSANGAVAGSGTIRYTTRETEKGWTVALAEEK